MWRLMTALIVGLPATAQAHHVGGEQLPDTFMAGLLSGFGHPLIGVDHFAFTIAVGFAAAAWKRGWFAAVAFVAMALVGCLLHIAGIDLPKVEVLIALSLVLVGSCFVLRTKLSLSFACAGLGLAGIFHGFAYGESIIGAGPSPLSAYLLGFTMIQIAMAGVAWAIARRMNDYSRLPSAVRAYGVVIGALGLTFIAS